MKLWNEIVNIIMYIWLTFIKIYRAVFKIFEKALKIENCAKFIIVLLRKCLVLEIKRAQTNETLVASRHNFNSHLGVFWSSFIQSIYSVITLNKMHVSECSSRLYFRFKIKHTLFIILSCIFPVPYLLISEIGSNKIHALPIFISVLVYL